MLGVLCVMVHCTNRLPMIPWCISNVIGLRSSKSMLLSCEWFAVTLSVLGYMATVDVPDPLIVVKGIARSLFQSFSRKGSLSVTRSSFAAVRACGHSVLVRNSINRLLDW